ncbi:MAG TPA: hypothetical protein HA343_07335 [Methanomassiliicoccales archaeon]|jgi:hypothetical protein|nr:hypothetical protein [Methanomassiliicoccales archaeon]
MREGKVWYTPQQREADLVGILMWVVWFVILNGMFFFMFNDEGTNDLILSPLFYWVTIGPMFAFMFLGRRVMKPEMSAPPGSPSDMSNFATSVISVLAWGLVLLVWDIFYGADRIIGVSLGLVLILLLLMATNRRWNF